MWAAQLLTLVVVAVARDSAEEQGAQPWQRHPNRGHGEQPEQFEQGSGMGQQSHQMGQDYRQIMEKYAGNYSNYTKFIPMGMGPSMQGGAASNSSTPGFQEWLQDYVPAQDESQYTAPWTSRWSMMSAPMQQSYAKGHGGYMQYVQRYKSMEGSGVSSPGNWKDKMKSQETAYAKAVGDDVPYHADRHVDLDTSAGSAPAVDSAEEKADSATPPAEAVAPAKAAAPADSAAPAEAPSASEAASHTEVATPAEDATPDDADPAATPSEDAAPVAPAADAPRQQRKVVVSSPAMLLPARAGASFLAAAPPSPEDALEPDVPDSAGDDFESQETSRMSAWATISFGLLAVLAVVATRSLISRRPASLEEQGFQLLVDA